MAREIRRGEDEGASLPELLVSMLLFTMVVGAVGAVFVSTLSSVRTTTTTNGTTADARLAMEAVTRTVRVAVQPQGLTSALVEARPDRLVLFASLQRDASQSITLPTRVTYAYDAATACLSQTQVPASVNTGTDAETVPHQWTGPGATTCLVRTSVAPTFEYFDAGTLTTPAGVPIPAMSLPATGLSAEALPTVVSVQVSVTAAAPGVADVAGVTARDRVTLTNVLAARRPTGGA